MEKLGESVSVTQWSCRTGRSQGMQTRSLGEWSDPGSVRALSQESGEGRVEATALPTYSICSF